MNKILPVVLSIGVIIAIAIIQERSKTLAALLATMPLTAPLAIWVVYSASNGDRAQTAEFTRSMILGIVATAVFVIMTWIGLKAKIAFGWAMALGWGCWALFALGLPALLARLR